MTKLLPFLFSLFSTLRTLCVIGWTIVKWWIFGERFAWKRLAAKFKKDCQNLRLELRAAEADKYRLETENLQLKAEKEVIYRHFADNSAAQLNQTNKLIEWFGKALIGFGPNDSFPPPFIQPPSIPHVPSTLSARELANRFSRDTIAAMINEANTGNKGVKE
jgi:hypothetical protein